MCMRDQKKRPTRRCCSPVWARINAGWAQKKERVRFPSPRGHPLPPNDPWDRPGRIRPLIGTIDSRLIRHFVFDWMCRRWVRSTTGATTPPGGSSWVPAFRCAVPPVLLPLRAAAPGHPPPHPAPPFRTNAQTDSSGRMHVD